MVQWLTLCMEGSRFRFLKTGNWCKHYKKYDLVEGDSAFCQLRKHCWVLTERLAIVSNSVFRRLTKTLSLSVRSLFILLYLTKISFKAKKRLAMSPVTLSVLFLRAQTAYGNWATLCSWGWHCNETVQIIALWPHNGL